MIELVRITARVLRFISIIRDKKKYDSMYITRLEYLGAQAVWIKYHQNKHFAQDMGRLKEGKTIDNASTVLKMAPFLDGDGILRVGGRIKRSTMSFETRNYSA